MTERKAVLCHYEVVENKDHVGLHVRQNSAHIGHDGPLPTKPLKAMRFLNAGPNAEFWLVRDGEKKLWAIRLNGRVVSDLISHLKDREGNITISATGAFLRAGDGFVIVLPLEAWEVGPVDTTEGRPRPTVYMG